MEQRVNQIDVNAVNDRAREEAETVTPIGYEESRRLHEQMGNDMMTYLLAEYGMFIASEGIGDQSKEAQLITKYIEYVVKQWNAVRE